MCLESSAQNPPDSSGTLPFPLKDNRNPNQSSDNPFFLNKYTKIQKQVVYDPASGQYVLRQTINGVDVKPPVYMSFEEYLAYEARANKENYWRERSAPSTATGGDKAKSILPSINVNNEVFDRVFGSPTIDIRPQGSAELRFSGNFIKNENPALNVQQRRIANFDFKMNIQMSVVGNIGDKLKFTARQNTQAVFNFDNQMKLGYSGKEDEIIKNIEAGNVTLPLRSSLIQGSQSLFGLKTELQFGKLRVTTVLSQQKGQNRVVKAKGGAQSTEFEIPIDQYDGNRHFFLSTYFRDQYNRAMSSLPVIRSGVIITRVEVWVTPRVGGFGFQRNPDVRDVVGYLDMGTQSGDIYDKSGTIQPNIGNAFPSNTANNLYQQLLANPNLRKNNQFIQEMANGQLRSLLSSRDYEKIFAKKLPPNSYTFHPQLGYVSLNQSLNNDEVLAVAFEYTLNGQVYRVGEFSQEVPSDQANPSVLFLKLLKPANIRTDLPTWDLMMKNIYSLNAYDISEKDFTLNIIYEDVANGYKPFIPAGSIAGRQLIQVLNLDNLNVQQEPVPDGFFDFIPRITIDPKNGRVIFPLVEPFGKDLEDKFVHPTTGVPDPEEITKKYVFSPLYDSTRAWAQQFPSLNRYKLIGRYQGTASNEISLNSLNIPPGSVSVKAGNRVLTEGVDYRVDYNLGKVIILNPGIRQSGEPISVGFENNPLFQQQLRSMTAARFDYAAAKDLNLGATFLRLTERPIIGKVVQGDEPFANTIVGVDGSYTTKSRLLTRMIDMLPLIQTKDESSITLNAEYAHLFPGNARAIDQDGGLSYIDDFEGSENSIDMRLPGSWFLSSTPKLFPEASVAIDSLAYGRNRARLSWYYIDQLFLRNSGITPEHIQNDRAMKSHPYMREILEPEVFPNKQLANTQPINIQTLDLAYYPDERGMYNYDASRTDENGRFTDPQNRWAGIMRRVPTNDFEAANIEFVEFWLMDPYLDANNDSLPIGVNEGGDLYINLGNISEDVLKDGRRAFENGLPRTDDPNQVDTTNWGVVSKLQPYVNAFDNEPDARRAQDVGLDGLNSQKERDFFEPFLKELETMHGNASAAYQLAFNDPSSDDYHHFRGSDFDNGQFDILTRYKKFNGVEGNSPADEDSPEEYPTSATNVPSTEDINQDNVLLQEASEAYYEYRVSLRRGPDGRIQSKYIADVYEAPANLANGETKLVKWYQFRIPVQQPDKRYGNVSDFKSIRFMRMFMSNFTKPVVLRFATMQLVRTDWRRYRNDLKYPDEFEPQETDQTTFLVSTVNIEENGNRQPINYVLPEGVQRQQNAFATNFQQLNEQSLQLRFCDLEDGDSRAVFKTGGFDVRAYKRLKMFVHLEGEELNPDDVWAFVRFGSDFTDNYYEYAFPLRPSEYFNNTPSEVWPIENELDISFEELNNAKKMRNSSKWPFAQGYVVNNDRGGIITVKGNPQLSNLEVVMLGVRNPRAGTSLDDDDGLTKCGEVWFNELRLSDFDNRQGYAATGSASIQLANLGNVNIAGTFTSIGFGGVESRVAERSREQTFQYDLASNINLGKFTPEKFGLNVPMYFGFSEIFVTPEYNPLDQDILLEASLAEAESQQERDSIKNASRSYTRRKSINFTNVQKSRTSKGEESKRWPWDISNFAFNYSYSEVLMQDPFTQSDGDKRWQGGFNYQYSPNVKPIEPFKNLKPKMLGWLKSTNINPIPNTFTFRTDVDRVYHKIELRNNSFGGISLPPTVYKNFTWNRYYTMTWNITRALKIDYNAVMNTRLDEPRETVEEFGREAYKKAVWQGIKDSLGRPTKFNQVVNVNYNLPFDKFQILNWINGSVRYGATYDWEGAKLAAIELGNTIQNSQSIQGQLQFNMSSLYNKSKFLQKVQSGKPLLKPQAERKTARVEKKLAKQDSIQNQFGEKVAGKASTKSDSKVDYTESALRTFVGLFLTVKNVGFNYSENNGTLLPGFNQQPVLFGNNWNNNAPGWDFVLGKQFNYDDINEYSGFQNRILDNGWLVTDTALNALSLTTRSKNFTGRATLEPLRDLKVELNMNWTQSKRVQTNFRADRDGFIQNFNPIESGSFSVSIISWKTAFDKLNVDKESPDYLSSPTFRSFEESRLAIANRLASADAFDNALLNPSLDTLSRIQGYPNGYSRKSLDVLIPAFYAAYTGQDPSSVKLGFMPVRFPLPNWRINYTGLSRTRWARKIFRSFTISHSYSSTYRVGNYGTNLIYQQAINNGLVPQDTALSGDLYPQQQIAQISISEQLSPLIGLDFTFKNSITCRLEFKKTRTLTLSLANNRMTELNNKEFTIGLGYRMDNPKISFLFNGKPLKNDLNFRFDFNIRDNKTLLRDLDGQTTQSTGGIRTVSIKPNVSYVLNNRVTLRFFFDRIINTPQISTSYPNANTQAGISIRFTLTP